MRSKLLEESTDKLVALRDLHKFLTIHKLIPTLLVRRFKFENEEIPNVIVAMKAAADFLGIRADVEYEQIVVHFTEEAELN